MKISIDPSVISAAAPPRSYSRDTIFSYLRKAKLSPNPPPSVPETTSYFLPNEKNDTISKPYNSVSPEYICILNKARLNTNLENSKSRPETSQHHIKYFF